MNNIFDAKLLLNEFFAYNFNIHLRNETDTNTHINYIIIVKNLNHAKEKFKKNIWKKIIFS